MPGSSEDRAVGLNRDREIVNRVRQSLEGRFDIRDLILFGSRATGQADEHSDFDILVIAESEVPFFERQTIASRCVGKRDFPLDLLVFTPEEVQSRRSTPGSIVQLALQEGIRFDGS
jgi:predicted nucleotidyltransferase